MIYFPKRLFEARAKTNMTQEQLASECSVSTATIRNYEEGVCVNPTASVLLRLSTALGVSVDWLIGNEIGRENTKTAIITLFLAWGDQVRITTTSSELNRRLENARELAGAKGLTKKEMSEVLSVVLEGGNHDER